MPEGASANRRFHDKLASARTLPFILAPAGPATVRAGYPGRDAANSRHVRCFSGRARAGIGPGNAVAGGDAATPQVERASNVRAVRPDGFVMAEARFARLERNSALHQEPAACPGTPRSAASAAEMRPGTGRQHVRPACAGRGPALARGHRFQTSGSHGAISVRRFAPACHWIPPVQDQTYFQFLISRKNQTCHLSRSHLLEVEPRDEKKPCWIEKFRPEGYSDGKETSARLDSLRFTLAE